MIPWTLNFLHWTKTSEHIQLKMLVREWFESWNLWIWLRHLAAIRFGKRKLRCFIHDQLLLLLMIGKFTGFLIIMIGTDFKLHEPCRIGVSAGEFLHKVSELRGTGLDLHGGWYVNNFERLFASFGGGLLLFSAHVANTEHIIHGGKNFASSMIKKYRADRSTD